MGRHGLRLAILDKPNGGLKRLFHVALEVARLGGTALGIARLAGLEPRCLGRSAVADFVLSSHRHESVAFCREVSVDRRLGRISAKVVPLAA